MLSESPGYIIFRLFLIRRREYLPGFSMFNQFAKIKEGSIIANPGRLLHVVGHDGDGVVTFQFDDQLFNFCGGDGIKGAGRFIHQDDFGLHGKGSRNAHPLLLSARKPER